MGFDWKQTLAKIAPLAGGMIGGPFGALAGQAIGKVFGHDGDAALTEKEMSNYIQNATPEQLVQLKGIDSNLQIRLKELDIQEDQLVYDDKADARALQKVTKSSIPAALVIILTIGVFAMFAALMYFNVPEANKVVVGGIIGSVSTAWVGSVQFFVGTTKSSQDKTQIMAGGQ